MTKTPAPSRWPAPPCGAGSSCFPGYARLQADLQCSVNSVTKWMQELQGARLVTRRKRGQGKTTVYTFHDPPAPPPGLGITPTASAQTPKNGESEARQGQSRKSVNLHSHFLRP